MAKPKKDRFELSADWSVYLARPMRKEYPFTVGQIVKNLMEFDPNRPVQVLGQFPGKKDFVSQNGVIEIEDLHDFVGIIREV